MPQVRVPQPPRCKKETGARVVYDTDPEQLIAKLLEVYRTAHYRKRSCFCDERRNGG